MTLDEAQKEILYLQSVRKALQDACEEKNDKIIGLRQTIDLLKEENEQLTKRLRSEQERKFP